MAYRSRLIQGVAAVALLLFVFQVPLSAQDAPTAQLPVLLTSCGQSPGPLQIKFFLSRLGIDHEFVDIATVEDLEARKAAGTPFKTLIVVTGASLKGMGAAGVSMREELIRTAALMEAAKARGMTIIGAHVEGMSRRSQGAAAGDNSDEQSIDAVMPQADFMLVRQDGDEDRRFSIISETQGIPLILFEKNMEMGGVLEKIFNQ